MAKSATRLNHDETGRERTKRPRAAMLISLFRVDSAKHAKCYYSGLVGAEAMAGLPFSREGAQDSTCRPFCTSATDAKDRKQFGPVDEFGEPHMHPVARPVRHVRRGSLGSRRPASRRGDLALLICSPDGNAQWREWPPSENLTLTLSGPAAVNVLAHDLIGALTTTASAETRRVLY